MYSYLEIEQCPHSEGRAVTAAEVLLAVGYSRWTDPGSVPGSPERRNTEMTPEKTTRRGDDATALDALANALHMVETAQRHLRTRIAQHTGVNVTDLTVLTIVGDLGRLTPKLLASEITMGTGAVTAVIDRLVGAGLLGRVPNPRDRRSVFLELTDSGTETLARIDAEYRAAAEVALRASPALGTEETAEDIARAAIAMTAHTLDGPEGRDAPSARGGTRSARGASGAGA
jgi:DNA-binding MarR family transcriptional regulator